MYASSSEVIFCCVCTCVHAEPEAQLTFQVELRKGLTLLRMRSQEGRSGLFQQHDPRDEDEIGAGDPSTLQRVSALRWSLVDPYLVHDLDRSSFGCLAFLDCKCD